MQEIIAQILDRLRDRGADYGDVRFTDTRHESLEVKNRAVEAVRQGHSAGFGVRVLVDGAWGFAASSLVTAGTAAALADRALATARASGLVQKERTRLSALPAMSGTYSTPLKTDPFTVSLESKIDHLLTAEKLLHDQPAVRIGQAFFSAYRTDKTFASTEGSLITQRITECGGGLAATAIADSGEMQVRSYPNSFRGNFICGGYEFFRSLDLAGNAPRVADEAAALLTAPPCPAGKTTLVLDGGQLALQVHESVGHATELDRIFGMEAGYAGTSFLKPDDLDTLRYGSDLVNITADATTPGGLGTFGYDDEGVPAACDWLVKEGVLRGFMSSRETAVRIGRQSNGCMRADGWSRIPLVRMTNVNLLPGKGSFDELIGGVDRGIYMATNRSWSIDDKRLNFQFGTELAREIKNGKLGQLYKNPTYTGITPQFWNSCDGICGAEHWQMWGTPNCGKGEPGQTAHVGHGTAPARFRNVETGVLS